MTPREVRKALVSLGRSRDSIARKLTAMGMKGRKADGCFCPIAMYLRQLGAGDVEVDADEVVLLETNDCAAIRLPKAAGSFVVYFDSGAYPDLVTP